MGFLKGSYKGSIRIRWGSLKGPLIRDLSGVGFERIMGLSK